MQFWGASGKFGVPRFDSGDDRKAVERQLVTEPHGKPEGAIKIALIFEDRINAEVYKELAQQQEESRWSDNPWNYLKHILQYVKKRGQRAVGVEWLVQLELAFAEKLEACHQRNLAVIEPEVD